MYFQLIYKTIIQLIVENSLYKHGPIIPLRGYGWTQNFYRFLLIALDVFVAVDIVVGFIVEDFFKMLKFIDGRVTDILVVVDMAVGVVYIEIVNIV